MLSFYKSLVNERGATIIKPYLTKSLFIILILLYGIVFISSNTSAAYIKPTTDPTVIGIGARPIGMGKAYVGLSDDINSVFMNPAGLAGLKTWQILSMTTRLINEIDYVSFAGTYNTDIGTFGLGYVGANLGGSFVTGLRLVSDRGIVFPVATEEGISYTSSVMLLSYGSEARRFYDHEWLNNISVGVSLKIFNQGLTGGGISDGLLTGYDMDFGMLYKPLPWLSFGWNQIDALSVDMGGKLVDSSGERVHSLPTTTKMGLAFKVLGEEGALYQNPQPLVYLLDFDYMPYRAFYPTTFRTGVEWWPSSYLAIRFGLDQDIVGNDEASGGYSVDTNPTAGVGIYYGGFSFDYAYHRYGILSENETRYLSLCYSAPVEMPAPPKVQEYIKITSPKDKSIVYDEAAEVRGQLFNVTEITNLKINGSDVVFYPDGTFEATYPLLLGKNKFIVNVMRNDTQLASAEVRILRLSSFKDVPGVYWAREPIEYLATLGIIGGYPDGTFRPDKLINRAELTTLLIKAKSISSTETMDTSFADVTRKHWASYYIKNGADLGLVTGYPDKTFRPANSLNRAEGVTILTRFAELKEPETILEGPFPDVPGRHWAAKSITSARSAGMLVYLTDKPFEPTKAMTRAEAAEILSKTPFASLKINNLTDFDSY